MSDAPAEFSLIARHFRPLAGPGALDLLDDAAVFVPPPGRELVVAADALVAGVHFRPDDPADLVGAKLLNTDGTVQEAGDGTATLRRVAEHRRGVTPRRAGGRPPGRP